MKRNRRVCQTIYCCIVWMTVISGWLVAGLTAESASSSDDNDPRLVAAALEAGHLQWVNEVNFVCTFQALLGYADNEHDAKTLLDGALEIYGSGIMVKKGTAIRLKFLPTAPVEAVNPNDAADRGPKAYRNVAYDEVGTPDRQLMLHYPSPAVPRTVLTVARKSDEQKGPSYQAGLDAATILNPLSLGGPRFLEPYQPSPNKSELTFEIEEQDDERTVIKVKPVVQGEWEVSRIIEFWTEVSPPIIRRSTNTAKHSRTGDTSETSVEGNDFVEVNGLYLAKEIRYTLHNKISDQESWKIGVYKSGDIQDRLPVDDDFAVTIPDGVKVEGLQGGDKFLPGDSINLLKLDNSDLIKRVSTGKSQSLPPASTPNPGQSGLPWLLIANVGVLVAVLVWIAMSRFLSKRF